MSRTMWRLTWFSSSTTTIDLLHSSQQISLCSKNLWSKQNAMSFLPIKACNGPYSIGFIFRTLCIKFQPCRWSKRVCNLNWINSYNDIMFMIFGTTYLVSKGCFIEKWNDLASLTTSHVWLLSKQSRAKHYFVRLVYPKSIEVGYF